MEKNKPMERFLKLTKMNIYDLVLELDMSNNFFNSCLEKDLMELACEKAKETKIIADVIKGRPEIEREEYFMAFVKLFCEAHNNENKEKMIRYESELKYFQHCFMQDTDLRKKPITFTSMMTLL